MPIFSSVEEPASVNSADNIANNISLEHGYYSSAKEPPPVNYRIKIATNSPLEHAYCSV